MDIMQQLINNASDRTAFLAAAAAVRHHIESNRDPSLNLSLMVSLSMRGHYLITQGCTGEVIADAVMRTLNTEPREDGTMVA